MKSPRGAPPPRRCALPPRRRRATTMPAATTNKALRDGAAGFVLFETAIGRCALLWRGGLVIGAALPEKNDAAMRPGLARRFPDSEEAPPPPFVRQAISLVVRLLAGEK